MKYSRRMFARAGLGAVGLATMATPFRFAGATGLIAGATEPTQIMNNVELVTQVVQQAEQLSYDIDSYLEIVKQYKNMVTNTMTIPNQIWSNVQQDLMGVFNVVKQGQGLAFSMSNIGEQFKLKYPGYKPTTDFTSDYKKWSGTLMDTIKGTLEAANLQSQQFTTEEGVMQQLRSMSQSNQGRMQAIQTGNQIAVETTAQLQKLRVLTMAQLQSQNAYMAKTEQEKDTVRASVETMLKRGSVKPERTYKKYE